MYISLQLCLPEHGWNVVPAEKSSRSRSDVSLPAAESRIVATCENREGTSPAAATTIGSADVTVSGLRAGGLRSSTNSNTLCKNLPLKLELIGVSVI
jgi:hypothetical protein